MSQLLDQPPITLIPESAPFDAEQRAWLNGFFAGWLGLTGNAPATAIAAVPGGDAPLPLPSPEEHEAFPWHDPALPIAERIALAEDKPLPRRLMAAMAQLDCGACGYVCQTYAEKIAAGEENRLTLCSPGGKETAKTLKRLLGEAPQGQGVSAAEGQAVAQAADVPGSHADPKWSRDNPYRATLLRAVNLNGTGSDKRTTHVELDLGDGGLTYEVGDSLGVWPTNCGELVADLLGRLGAFGDEPVRVGGTEIAFRDGLRSKLCLAEVTEELLLCLAEAAEADEAHHLRDLAEDDGPLAGCDVLDVLRLFPSARPAPAALAAALAPLRPRLYSISSSPKAHPGRVHLTVGRVVWEHNGRTRKGVCSTLFADRLEPGAAVPVYVQKSHGFTLPADPAAPVVMIGPGTGIAPFRAFLEERAATGATGRNWLFFGDRRAATDFLYRDELDAWRRSGLLTRLDLAFSRDGDAKVYVQDRMRENAAELRRWLDAGASVYVCGDAKRMAADVDRALRDVVSAGGGVTPEKANAYVARLTADGRYRRDVY